MNKATAIMHKYPKAVPLRDFTVADNGDGIQYLAHWDVKNADGDPEPEPSQEDFEAWWAEYEAAQEGKTPPETPEQKIARLEAENSDLKQRTADIELILAGIIGI